MWNSIHRGFDFFWIDGFGDSGDFAIALGGRRTGYVTVTAGDHRAASLFASHS